MAGADTAARLKGRVRKRFRQNNPDAFAKANGDVETVTELGRIEARGQKIKEKTREHFQRHKEPWIAKEAIRLWKNHTVQTAKHPAPEGAVTDLSPEALMHKARQNVQSRVVRRLGRINDMKTRMQNSVVRNKEQQSPQEILTTPGLKQEFRRKGPEM